MVPWLVNTLPLMKLVKVPAMSPMAPLGPLTKALENCRMPPPMA